MTHKERIEWMQANRNTLLTDRQIAEKLGTTPGTIANIRTRHGAKRDREASGMQNGQMVTVVPGARRTYWSRQMLDLLRMHFATTMNEEMASMLGVSVRTAIRKARTNL